MQLNETQRQLFLAISLRLAGAAAADKEKSATKANRKPKSNSLHKAA